jgi:hypothetical protein
MHLVHTRPQFGVIASDLSLHDIKVELDNIQDKLDSVTHDLEAEILGTARQQMRIDIANQASQSLISVNAAIGFTQNPADPQQQNVFTLALRDSADAVKSLESDAYWIQVFSLRVFYDDNWSGTLAPPEAPVNSLVFDYRYTLPAYILAVHSRITVLLAADKSFQVQLIQEVQQFTEKLRAVHDRILAVFQFIPAPTRSLIFDSQPGNFPGEAPGKYSWPFVDYIYGVVNTYSGTSATRPYPKSDIPQFVQSFNPELAAETPDASHQFDIFCCATNSEHAGSLRPSMSRSSRA